MLQERLTAAHAVRDAYLDVKFGTAELRANVTGCLRTMDEQRTPAGLKIGDGMDAYAAIAEASALLARAELLIASAHPTLAGLIEKAGLTRHYASNPGYGDDQTHPFTRALRAA